MAYHKVCTNQHGSKHTLSAERLAAFSKYSTRICVIIHIKSKFLINLVKGQEESLQFCNEFLDLVNDTHNIVNTLLISDEAHLHMSGFMNKQNCRYWAPNNPHECQQRLPHNANVTVWCSISSHGITGPHFFKNEGGHTVTVDTEWYKVILETFLQNGLHPCQVDLVCFQQDGATAHMAQTQCKFSVQCFQADSYLVLEHITWLTRSPDHAVLDYFLSGYEKSKV